MTDRSLSVFYVADGHRLERQSWLLAVTLAHAHRDDPRVRQIAYVSASYRDQITDATKAIYEVCGVELRNLPPLPKWKSGYPHGNKIVAACDVRGSTHSVFIDTDIVCMKPLTALMDLSPDTVAAAPEGRRTWGGLDRWERAYAHFGLPMPTERVRLLRNGVEYVPYYNAGLVAFPEAPHPEHGKRFSELWLETAVEFDRGCSIARKRPWLDQISLPLAMARFGYQARVLEEEFNYSLLDRKDYSQTPDARILHYHRFHCLAQAPQYARIRALMLDTVQREHHEELNIFLGRIDTAPERRLAEGAA